MTEFWINFLVFLPFNAALLFVGHMLGRTGQSRAASERYSAGFDAGVALGRQYPDPAIWQRIHTLPVEIAAKEESHV